MPSDAKVGKRVVAATANAIIDFFEGVVIPEVKDIIYDDYNTNLVNRVTNRKSKARPEDYLEDFMDAIEAFEYLTLMENKISLRIPDIDNFKFSGRLRAVEQILHGISGIYFEVDEDSYISMFGKKPTNEDPVDNEVPKKDRFYLVRHSKIPRSYKNKFVKYPFSNTPPVDIFEGANKYVDENIPNWLGLSIKEVKRKGV